MTSPRVSELILEEPEVAQRLIHERQRSELVEAPDVRELVGQG